MTYLEKIGQWYDLQNKLAALKDQEMALRQEIFAAQFPTPAEGVNSLDLPEGWTLKGTYKINRTIDEAALPAVLEALRKKKLATEALVAYKPSLVIKGYRALSDDHRRILEQALVIKPGAPSLELIAPKKG